MGMYDYVKCDMPLHGDLNDKLFYTRSFDSDLSTYRISEIGELYKITNSIEIVEEKDRPFWDTDLWSLTPLYQLVGCLKLTPQEEVPVFIDALIDFSFFDSDTGVMHDVSALIIDGFVLRSSYKPKVFDKITKKWTEYISD